VEIGASGVPPIWDVQQNWEPLTEKNFGVNSHHGQETTFSSDGRFSVPKVPQGGFNILGAGKRWRFFPPGEHRNPGVLWLQTAEDRFRGSERCATLKEDVF